MAEWVERVLAAHPPWPWPLIEEEARRRAAEDCHQSGPLWAIAHLTPDQRAGAA
jgi:hypothetical protein